MADNLSQAVISSAEVIALAEAKIKNIRRSRRKRWRKHIEEYRQGLFGKRPIKKAIELANCGDARAWNQIRSGKQESTCLRLIDLAKRSDTIVITADDLWQIT